VMVGSAGLEPATSCL